MSEPFVYSLVLLAYLGALVLVGFITGRRTKSVEDFYIGGRQIGPWVTALSFVAAYFSSVVIIGGGGFGYMFGMSTLWIGAINVLLGCTVAWIVLGPRIRTFTQRLKTMTVPGFIGERFQSDFACIFSALIIVLFMIIYNVSILKGMGHIFEVLMNIPYVYGVLISCIIILFYVSIGGYLAVVWTSFIQAWVMGIGLIVLTVFTLHRVGGITAANSALASIDPGLLHTPGVWGWPGLLSFALIVSFGVWGMPQLVVRFYSIKNLSVLKIGTVVATVGTCMALLPYFNGAIARTLFPSLASPDLAIPTLVKTILSPFGAAIVLAGVVAAGMSTFSSVLIILSSSMVQDLIKKGIKRDIVKEKSLFWGKIGSIVIGFISLVIALRPPALVLTLTAFAWAVIASTTLWPILFGIYWKGATRLGCIASMVGGCVTALFWMLAGKPFGVHGFIPGIIVGFLLMVLVSRATPKFPAEHISRVWG
ncbi:MAG: sodium/proline symporter [candidate division WOR-3 bacterium]|nr:MAG: sodium/proline symporter [candidate division WOR-3 bacterium]